MAALKLRPWVPLILVTALGVGLRVALLPLGNGLDGNPVDVYYVDREAAQLVVQLRDPYLFSDYTNHYGGVVTFAYLPVIPLYFAPFVFAGVDIRYGAILADAVTTIAVYFIAQKAVPGASGWVPLAASGLYAVLPISLWLTSVLGSNIMVGAMFLALALALLLSGRSLLAGAFFGVALATNQLVLVLLPILALYCLRRRDVRTPLVSVLVAALLVLPFLLYSPSRFLDDTVLFELQRPLQQNGVWSLYYLVYSGTSFAMGTYLRLLIFAVPAALATLYLSKNPGTLLAGCVAVTALAAFVLPVDGFWSYFLIPLMVLCALLPPALARRSTTS